MTLSTVIAVATIGWMVFAVLATIGWMADSSSATTSRIEYGGWDCSRDFCRGPPVPATDRISNITVWSSGEGTACTTGSSGTGSFVLLQDVTRKPSQTLFDCHHVWWEGPRLNCEDKRDPLYKVCEGGRVNVELSTADITSTTSCADAINIHKVKNGIVEFLEEECEAEQENKEVGREPTDEMHTLRGNRPRG